MGTKVHQNSYLFGNYPTRDINENAPSTWHLQYEDRILNGMFYSSFTSKHSEYDRELLRQTMLRHEEIFRKQVLELHRLYRIQRDLMVELRRKGEKKSSMQVLSSQPSPLSTEILPQGTQKSWQHDAFSLISTSCCMVTLSGVDDSQTHLRLLNGPSFLSDPMSRENGDSPDVNQLLDFKRTKLPRRMLDLQLSADAYLDNDDVVPAEQKDVIKPLFGSAHLSNKNCELQPENDVNLALGTAQNASREIKESNSRLRNGLLPHNMADLNEPLNEVSHEQVAVSSRRFPVKTANCEGLEGHQNSMESVSSFLGVQKDLFHDRYRGGVGSAFLCIDRGQSSNHASFSPSSVSKKDVQQSSEHDLVKPEKLHDFSSIFSPKKSRNESWFREKCPQPSQINELSDISYNGNSKYSGLTFPTISDQLSALPCTDYTETASPLVSSWRKPLNSSLVSLEFQAPSYFTGSTTMNIQSRSSCTSSQKLGNAWKSGQVGHDRRSTSNFGCETCLYPNGLHHAFLSGSSASSHAILPPISFDRRPNLNNSADYSYEKPEGHGPQENLKNLCYTDVKNVKDVNLNASPPNGFWNEFVPPQKIPSDVEGKKKSPSGMISWPRTESPCSEHINKSAPRKEFCTMQGYSRIISNHCTLAPEMDQKKETEHSLVDVVQDLPTILTAKEAKTQHNEPVSLSCKKILGFHVPECGKISSTSISHQQIFLSGDESKRVKEEFPQADSPYQSKSLDHVDSLVPEKVVGIYVNGFKDDMNLNSFPTGIDQPNTPTCSSKDEIELHSTVSVHGTATRFVSEIDLEAPITALPEEQIPSAEPASHPNQPVSTVERDSKRQGLQATEIRDETLVKMAAETICMISLDKPVHSEGIVLCPSPPASDDILHWFADVVTSNSDDLGHLLGTLVSAGADDQESSDIDGMDYFEYMTLRVKETKVGEICCRHLEIENSKEEETGITHLLLSRSRRGQARRRRQRRDFQKDILPGLASLSRCEVTDDLQVIGGLMRASGQQWQPGGVRTTGRTRPRRQVKGTHCPSGNATAAAAAFEIPVDPQPRRSSNTDVELDARFIVGWGRTTRRCRRLRCPSGNILVPSPS